MHPGYCTIESLERRRLLSAGTTLPPELPDERPGTTGSNDLIVPQDSPSDASEQSDALADDPVPTAAGDLIVTSRSFRSATAPHELLFSFNGDTSASLTRRRASRGKLSRHIAGLGHFRLGRQHPGGQLQL
jgi:hypothetical protein